MSLRILQIDELCTGCGACVSSCPKKALSLEYNAEGFYYPKVNKALCVDCNLCEKVCHALNAEKKEDIISRDYTPYMLKAKSKDLVYKSSSGGIFSLLSDDVLSNGGVVYGARYNYNAECLEHCSTDHCDISELRKSKYIESYTGDIFKDVREQLLKSRKVLFCGTPCQIEGLNTFLKKRKVPTDNLLLVRFICHGVPSNKFFTEYKHWIEKKVKSKIVRLDFRPKTEGWRKSNLLLEFSNGKIIDEPHTYNYYYYYYYFQKNYLLRKSCYKCKRINYEVGDITIGDFWGIYKYAPQNNDQDGISLALFHTQKGLDVLNKISSNCEFEELPLSAVDYIYKDSSWRESCLQYRQQMMDDVLKNGYMPSVIKTVRGKILKRKFTDKIKKIIKELILWKE